MRKEKFREIMKKEMPEEKLPSGYQIIGDIMLLKMPKLSKAEQIRIAESLLSIYPYVKNIAEIYSVSGEYRKPKVKLLAGKTLETIHTEYGIQYKIHLGKLMFSKGNLSERHRLESIVAPDDVIIDMFAGIGYFSLGLAKKAKKIYAIEKNKAAFNYLKENIKLNEIGNITPRLGDCRRIRIKEKADRVLMGYLPGTEKYLNAAFRFIKPSGIIHFHNTYTEKELWKKPLLDMEKAAKKNGYRIKNVIEKREVKSYAPRVFHVVLDVEVEKC